MRQEEIIKTYTRMLVAADMQEIDTPTGKAKFREMVKELDAFEEKHIRPMVGLNSCGVCGEFHPHQPACNDYSNHYDY